MFDELKNKRVAVLMTDGFEESEYTEPRKALEKAGAEIVVIAPDKDQVRSWQFTDWGSYFKVDQRLESAHPEDYDALLLPGGVQNPDTLRTNEHAVAFAKYFLESKKPIGAICHGPQLLIETKLLHGRKMTSFKALKTDLENAGVKWVDKEMVCDQGIVTSRTPDDLPAFTAKLVEEIAEGKHERRKVA